MIARMSNDMEQAKGFITELYGKLMLRPFEAVGYVIAMFVMDWRLALALLAILTPTAIILQGQFKKTKKRAHQARDAKSIAGDL